MARGDKGFEQMFEMWQQGQEAFMKAQSDAVDEFNRNFSNPATAQPFAPGPEAMKTWQGFVNSWAPAWNPSAMMANSSGVSSRCSELLMALPPPLKAGHSHQVAQAVCGMAVSI